MPRPNPKPNDLFSSCSACYNIQGAFVKLPCVRYRLADCLLNRYKCTVLDWPDILQHKERSAAARWTITCEKSGPITCAFKKSYGPPLNISIRGLALGEKDDGPAPEVMPLNALGIQSLEQASNIGCKSLDRWVPSHLYR